jgi:hypothetical protein
MVQRVNNRSRPFTVLLAPPVVSGSDCSDRSMVVECHVDGLILIALYTGTELSTLTLPPLNIVSMKHAWTSSELRSYDDLCETACESAWTHELMLRSIGTIETCLTSSEMARQSVFPMRQVIAALRPTYWLSNPSKLLKTPFTLDEMAGQKAISVLHNSECSWNSVFVLLFI